MQSSGTSRDSQVGAGMPVALQATSIVLRRPQFRLVGGELFFLASRRPYARLSPIEVAMWTALDGGPSLAKLRVNFFGETDRVLRRLIGLGICEIAETGYQERRRRVLLFEPHSDDAVLSVGGMMWLRRRECEFEVVTVGSKSNFTSYYYLDRDYFNVDEISVASQWLRVPYLVFCWADNIGGFTNMKRRCAITTATGRWNGIDGTENQSQRSSTIIRAWRNFRHGLEAIRIVLRDSRADEVWFPLGSPHTDHQLTRNALLALLHSDPMLFEGREVYFYQDVPYAVRDPKFTPTVLNALTQAGAILVPEVISVSSTFDEKKTS